MRNERCVVLKVDGELTESKINKCIYRFGCTVVFVPFVSMIEMYL